MGCGRFFEGTPAQMWASLQKLMELPDDMRVYCAHEYTQSNGRFAVTLEPRNAALAARVREVTSLRAAGAPTVPSTIGLEKATNPFLRPASPELRQTLGMSTAPDDDVLGETRRRKDQF
jgi:hydroxyacylglutathione hydrolase